MPYRSVIGRFAPARRDRRRSHPGGARRPGRLRGGDVAPGTDGPGDLHRRGGGRRAAGARRGVAGPATGPVRSRGGGRATVRGRTGAARRGQRRWLGRRDRVGGRALVLRGDRRRGGGGPRPVHTHSRSPRTTATGFLGSLRATKVAFRVPRCMLLPAGFPDVERPRPSTAARCPGGHRGRGERPTSCMVQVEGSATSTAAPTPATRLVELVHDGVVFAAVHFEGFAQADRAADGDANADGDGAVTFDDVQACARAAGVDIPVPGQRPAGAGPVPVVASASHEAFRATWDACQETSHGRGHGVPGPATPGSCSEQRRAMDGCFADRGLVPDARPTGRGRPDARSTPPYGTRASTHHRQAPMRWSSACGPTASRWSSTGGSPAGPIHPRSCWRHGRPAGRPQEAVDLPGGDASFTGPLKEWDCLAARGIAAGGHGPARAPRGLALAVTRGGCS